MKPFSFLILWLTLLAPLAAEEISRGAAIARALDHNLQLTAARRTVAAAEAAAAATGLMPNPELATGVGSTVEGEYEFELAFRQRFPLTDRLRLERRVGELTIEAARFEVLAAERELAQKAEMAWWEMLASQQRVERLRALQTVLLAQARTTSEAASRGEASELDARRIRLEANRLKREIGEARIEALLASETLANAMSNPPGNLPTAAGTFALPARPEVAMNALVDRHPAVRAADLGLAEAETQTALAIANRWQDPSAGLVLRQSGSEDVPEGYGHDTFLGIEFSLPLPLHNDGSATIEAAESRVEVERARIEAARAEVARRIAAAREVVAARHALAVEYREVVDETVETEALLREAWSRGEASLIELLDARRELQRTEAEALELILGYHRAATQLRVLALSEEPLRSQADFSHRTPRAANGEP